MISNCVESNFRVIANHKINVELMLLLNKIRAVVYAKDKATITINVDNTDDSLSFNFVVNGNEIEPIKTDTTFNIL